MTAFSSIYSSMTGLLSFSSALNTIGNNVANLNTPGFKARNVQFRDLGIIPADPRNPHPEDDRSLIGQGVGLGGSTTSFSQGETQQTGNDTDLAINGTGFFVLNEAGKQVFTRAGQFKFDGSGFLVDSVSGAHVQSIDAAGNLSDLVVNPFQTSPPVPTTEVKLVSNLSTGSPQFQIDNIKVIDASGSSRTLSVKFTNNTATIPGSWKVEVLDSTGASLMTGEIRFQGDGSPASNFNTLTLNLPAGSLQSSIKLNFGTPGSFDGATSFSAGSQSTIKVGSTDGSLLGVLQGITIDREGTVQLAFSNGKTAAGPQLALATFSDPQSLLEIGKAHYIVDLNLRDQTNFGRATHSGFGDIKSQTIELANVNLSEEFSNIVILQRGFQGSSQVLNVSSKLLEDLYNSAAGKG